MLRAYSDVDYGNGPTNHKSVTGFCIFFGDSLISLKSNKQLIVSLSSTKVKYRVMASIAKDIVWLHWLIAYMKVFLSHLTPMYCDNKSAI